MSANLSEATSHIPSFTAMPLYGLNCYSILRHDTLVLSRRALDLLEEKLLKKLYKTGCHNRPFRYIDHKQKLLAEGEFEDKNEAYPPFI